MGSCFNKREALYLFHFVSLLSKSKLNRLKTKVIKSDFFYTSHDRLNEISGHVRAGITVTLNYLYLKVESKQTCQQG